jgi:hypothetical protein
MTTITITVKSSICNPCQIPFECSINKHQSQVAVQTTISGGTDSINDLL